MQRVFIHIIGVFFLITAVRSFAQAPADSVDYNAVTGDVIIQPGADFPAIVKSRMFVTVSANKSSAFVGEPILVTYRFYTALNSKSQVARHPQFVNCSVAELPYDTDPYTDSFRGKIYNVYIIRRVSLTPLQAGNLVLGPAYVDNVAELVSVGDPFHPQQYSITLSNQPQVIQVYPLPEKSKPAGFSGVTGKFSISANAVSNKIAAGENDHLIVTIKGSGNIEAVALPAIRWPDNTEHFDASDTQHIQTDSFPVSGTKTFDIPFIGKAPGAAVIPPIEFVYFNPSARKYTYLQTDSIHLSFTEADATPHDNIVSGDIGNSKYLWIVAGIAVVVLLSFIISYRKQDKEKITTQKQAEVKEALPPATTPEPINFNAALQRIMETEDLPVFLRQAKPLILEAIAEALQLHGTNESVLLAAADVKLHDAALKADIRYFMHEYNMALYSPAEHDIVQLKVLTERMIRGLVA